MTETKTVKQALIEARNEIAKRYAYAMADHLYHTKAAEQEKDNTQEKVTELNNAKEAKKRAQKDGEYLKCFDELIEKAK